LIVSDYHNPTTTTHRVPLLAIPYPEIVYPSSMKPERSEIVGLLVSVGGCSFGWCTLGIVGFCRGVIGVGRSNLVWVIIGEVVVVGRASLV